MTEIEYVKIKNEKLEDEKMTESEQTIYKQKVKDEKIRINQIIEQNNLSYDHKDVYEDNFYLDLKNLLNEKNCLIKDDKDLLEKIESIEIMYKLIERNEENK